MNYRSGDTGEGSMTSKQPLAANDSVPLKQTSGCEIGSVPRGDFRNPGPSSHFHTLPDSTQSQTPDGVNTGLGIGERASVSLDMADYLDPAFQRVHGGSPAVEVRSNLGTRESGTTSSHIDPVGLGYLSVLEAEHLVSMFHRRLNPVIALLDPALHTFSYLRSKSPILFTSVLCASSKFHQPGVFDTLHAHAQTVTNREVTRGAAKVELVQSILILIYWKSPTDKSIWIKLCMAVGMANQMRLHVTTTKSSFPTEGEARAAADAERTWYCLKCFDDSYSQQFGLGPLISSDLVGDVEAWAYDLGEIRCADDMHLAFSIEVAQAENVWFQLRKTPCSPSVLQALEDIEARRLRLEHKWFTRQRHLIEDAEGQLRLLFKRNTFAIRRTRFDMTSSSDLRSECITLASEVIDASNALAEQGKLRHLQDVGSVILSEIGLFFYKAFADLSFSERRSVILLMRKVHSMCTRGDTHPDSAPAFIARFYGRLLRSLDIQSRIQSRAGSPHMDLQNNPVPSAAAASPAADFLWDEFLLVPETFEGIDDRYW
ncbi:hypothetical protein C362_05356 [Cryptococcus neoformans Bt1]|nr:hypothetical protein C362_05356 [Cryptococcus neoformans var. grubii Bt1]OXG13612.1 hypothetical protein C367_06159 [Cryptococcus neoformans var. grubii Ze90-1]